MHPWPAIVFLLVKAPRSAHELEELTGSGYEAIRTALRRLEDEGLAAWTYRTAKRNNRGRERVWRWAA